MSAQVSRKSVGERSRHAVVEINNVRHVFATAVPRVGDTLRRQARDAVAAIVAAMRFEGAAVVSQVVFLGEHESIPACRQIIRELYGRDMPATTYIPQSPCAGTRLAIEALGLGGDGTGVAIRRISDQLVVAHHNDMDWVYAGGALPRTSAPGVYEKATCALQHLRRLLPGGGAQFSQIVRAWFYLGGIVADEGPNQRYKEFNRARTDFYQDIRFLEDRLPDEAAGRAFPASTGIGTTGRGIAMSALAIAGPRPDVVAVPLENPRQTSAFNYSRSYSPQSPKFSRGMALCCGQDNLLFVSGTASITQAETRHPEDVEAQTHETLENIAALISEENLSRHGLVGAGTSLDGLGVIRVYVKRPEDFARVRAVCDSRLGGLPATYVVADVCRPDLLVEIEGIAFSHGEAFPAPVARGRCHVAGESAYPEAGDAGRCGPYCPGTCPERFLCPYAVLPPNETECFVG